MKYTKFLPLFYFLSKINKKKKKKIDSELRS